MANWGAYLCVYYFCQVEPFTRTRARPNYNTIKTGKRRVHTCHRYYENKTKKLKRRTTLTFANVFGYRASVRFDECSRCFWFSFIVFFQFQRTARATRAPPDARAYFIVRNNIHVCAPQRNVHTTVCFRYFYRVYGQRIRTFRSIECMRANKTSRMSYNVVFGPYRVRQKYTIALENISVE